MDMKKILPVLALLLAALAVPTLAQEGQPASEDAPTLSEIQIAFWPEFDRPEVLVIYRGWFTPDTPLPVPVEIRIPARVGQPSAVAFVDEAGQRFNQEYTTRTEGDELVVSFELSTAGFQLEYYDDLPADQAGLREYTFTHKADYPTTALNLEFQVPPTASAFVLEPPADSVVNESDGLTYHLVQAGPLLQGDMEEWTFAYQKDNEELTVSGFTPTPTPVPAAAPALGGSDNSTVLLFLVAFVALVGVGAGAFWLGRRAQPPPEPPPQPRRRGSASVSSPQAGRRTLPDAGGPGFCHKCGAQQRHDAEFCHKCGAEVRRG